MDNAKFKLAILVRANKVSGAERRAINIACVLASRSDLDVELWLDGRLTDIIDTFEIPSELSVIDYGIGAKASRFFNRGRHYFALRQIIGFNRFERAVRTWKIRRLCERREVDVLHVFLDNGIDVISDVCQIREVTSREEAAIVSAFPARLRKKFYFNAVSRTVLDMLTDKESSTRRDTIGVPFHFNRSGRFCCAQKEKIIVWAHRMIPRKNGVLFAKSIRRFLEERADWSVEILGSGPEEGNIKRVLSGCAHSDRINVGYSSNLVSILERSSVFVSLIEPDNYPSQSIFEAMTSQNALLLSDTGSTREMLFSDNGMICDLDEESIFAALMFLTENPARTRAMGVESRNIMNSRYDSSLYIDKLMNMYRGRLGL